MPEAAKLASRERFRAVMLTSLTTIAGLIPLLSERSLQAQVLIPLATSIVFGLLASTVLVLVAVPALFSIWMTGGGRRWLSNLDIQLKLWAGVISKYVRVHSFVVRSCIFHLCFSSKKFHNHEAQTTHVSCWIQCLSTPYRQRGARLYMPYMSYYLPSCQ
ncbi:MAG: efflux RND transporter permease subunit [Candidatus Competibacteraceae bacterium]